MTLMGVYFCGWLKDISDHRYILISSAPESFSESVQDSFPRGKQKMHEGHFSPQPYGQAKNA
jgi:hypothetical protein